MIDVTDNGPAMYPAVAVNDAGEVVFAWALHTNAYVRTFVDFGTPGSPFPVDHRFSGHNSNHIQVDVAIDSIGNWYLVVSDWRYKTDKAAVELYRFDVASSRILGPIELMSPIAAWNDIHRTQIALSRLGALAVVWDGADNAQNSSAQVRLFDTSGNPIGPLQRLGSGCCQYTDVSINSYNYSVVTWREGSAIFAQVFEPSGSNYGSPIPVATGTSVNSFTNVGISDSGVITFVWATSDTRRVYQQRFNLDGVALSPIDEVTAWGGLYPRMAMNPRGEYVVVWHNPSLTRVRCRRYDAAGFPMQKPVPLNFVTKGPRYAVVGISPDGHFATAWSDRSWRCDDTFCGYFTDIWGRVFGPGLVATTFSGFVAGQTEQGVELSWEVESDDVILGFDVIRRELNEPLGISIVAGEFLPAETRTFIDRDVQPGSTYEYTVVAVTKGDGRVHSCPVQVRVSVKELSLGQNQPNPFNPNTQIPFYLPTVSEIELGVFSVEGQLIRTLFTGTKPAGSHNVEWDGRDEDGGDVASGVYFCRLAAGKRTITRKMVLLK